MGLLKAIGGALGSTFADQWKEIIVPPVFDEHTIVAPGILKSKSTGTGANQKGSDGVISSGSKIYVPENTAAIIFNQAGIESVVTSPGGYEYKGSEKSIFNGDKVRDSIGKSVFNRIGFGGITDSDVRIAYVNMREIRDIKYGTKGPLVYNDIFYGCDFEIYSYGSFTIQVTNPEALIGRFVPSGILTYSLDDEKARSQLLSDFMQSFNVAVSTLSREYRISQLLAETNKLSEQIRNDKINAGSWEERFGFKVVKVSIENIEYSDQSKKLVDEYNKKMMEMKPYKDISQETSDRMIKHGIFEGIKDKNNTVASTIFGLKLLNGQKAYNKSIKNQTKDLMRLKALLDKGVITEEEYNTAKKKILDSK